MWSLLANSMVFLIWCRASGASKSSNMTLNLLTLTERSPMKLHWAASFLSKPPHNLKASLYNQVPRDFWIWDSLLGPYCTTLHLCRQVVVSVPKSSPGWHYHETVDEATLAEHMGLLISSENESFTNVHLSWLTGLSCVRGLSCPPGALCCCLLFETPLSKAN